METKGLKRNMEATPRKHSVDSLKKTAILGISHIMQEVLQSNFNPKWWGTTMVQEKYQEQKAVTRDNINNNNIITTYQIYLNNTVHNLQTSTFTGNTKSAGLHLLHKS